MYSENPSEQILMFTKHGKKKQTRSTEGDCYNREHIVPQSFFWFCFLLWFQIFITFHSTDGKVNGMRSNNPFGVVTSPILLLKTA